MNTAPILADFDGMAAKRLSDNRDRYIAQSAATRNGVIAPVPPPAARRLLNLSAELRQCLPRLGPPSAARAIPFQTAQEGI